MPRKAKVPQESAASIQKEWLNLAMKLRERRLELGWTQDTLAEKLECEVTTIQAYEQLRRHPSVPTLIMLCRLLKLKLRID